MKREKQFLRQISLLVTADLDSMIDETIDRCGLNKQQTLRQALIIGLVLIKDKEE